MLLTVNMLHYTFPLLSQNNHPCAILLLELAFEEEMFVLGLWFVK